MEHLNRDLLIYLALEMDIPTLINYCSLNKKINLICNSKTFWMNKLNNDFPNTINKFSPDSDFKNIYISMVKKKEKYYTYIIEDEDPKITISEYIKKYKTLKNIRLKINKYYGKRSYINTFKVIGDFPSGTKLWITNGIGFLTKGEAIDNFNANNCLKYYVDDDFLKYRDDFLADYGRTPENVYGFKYDEAFTYYRKKLEDDSVIAHPSFEDCFDIYILKEVILP